jgi:hypothetical protein
MSKGGSMKLKAGLLCSLIIVIGISSISRAQLAVKQNGNTVIKQLSPHGNAVVVIQSSMLEGDAVKTCPAATPWGQLGLKKVSVVQNITISIAGEALAVPSSVYLGLSKIGHASLQYKDGGFILEVTGGDASEAYRMRLFFDKTGVNRRMLYDVEADQLLEDTEYHHVVLD